MKKLAIEVMYGSGKVSIKRFTTRKGVDNYFKRLAKATKIFDGHRYTSSFTFKKIWGDLWQV